MSTMVIGCNKAKEATFTEKNQEDYKGEITFWHFNQDEGPIMAEQFMKAYKNVKVNYEIISDKDQGYQTKITTTLLSGSGMPDVFCGESAFVKRFVNMEGGFADLSEKPFDAQSVVKDMIPYTVDIGKDTNGKIKALTYQATPGGIGYKRDIAKQYFGTDDPEKIGAMMSTPEKMLDMAKELNAKSNGKVKFFPGREELQRLYLGSRKTGWVKDGKFVIDPMVEKYIDMAKTYRDSGLEAGLTAWSQPWGAGIANDNVFAYAIPTWGISAIITANDKTAETKCNWGLATPPIQYAWGGTWLGIYDKSKNKELSWEFLKFITNNKDNLNYWAEKRGDFLNNKTLIKEKSAASTVNPLVNQNLYKFFSPMVDGINGNLMTEYDDKIQAALDDYLQSYLAGQTSKEDLMKNFKAKVKSDFPEIKVD
jgi:ABC-type glycerol-3-phosphate transport system substrate-binding protein